MESREKTVLTLTLGMQTAATPGSGKLQGCCLGRLVRLEDVAFLGRLSGVGAL